MFFRKKPESTEKNKIAEEIKDRGIYVLGSGCKKCDQLFEHVKQALAELQLEDEVAHISDFTLIASTGVMSTPALVVDKKVLAYGRVLSVEECKEMLQKECL